MRRRKPKNPEGISIMAAHVNEDRVAVWMHIDPNYNDIVVNGYGIKKIHAKKLVRWLNGAIKFLEMK